jgi:hypothetical protein
MGRFKRLAGEIDEAATSVGRLGTGMKTVADQAERVGIGGLGGTGSGGGGGGGGMSFRERNLLQQMARTQSEQSRAIRQFIFNFRASGLL